MEAVISLTKSIEVQKELTHKKEELKQTVLQGVGKGVNPINQE